MNELDKIKKERDRAIDLLLWVLKDCKEIEIAFGRETINQRTKNICIEFIAETTGRRADDIRDSLISSPLD